MNSERTVSIRTARRLAVAVQCLEHTGFSGDALAGPVDTDQVERLVRAIGCVQIDAVRAVENTQFLVLWSRLGSYDPALLDELLFEQFRLFEYWAHAASIVPSEDYPIHATRMRASRMADNNANAWIAANEKLQRHIVNSLRENGPLPTDAFEDHAVVPWKSSGWNDERNVAMMLTFLWDRGEVMIAGRTGRRRYWHLTDLCLPQHVLQNELTPMETQRRAIQRSLQALGVATPAQIRQHFTRDRYPQMLEILDSLTSEQLIEKVRLVGDSGTELDGDWYVHASQLEQLEAIERNGLAPRTVLLSPFDNLICDRARTEQLFGYHFRIEIYVPKAKRQYGYYVLPVLHGDRLVGRIDPRMDRQRNRLIINAIYAESDAPEEAGPAIRDTIFELADFLGADKVQLPRTKPAVWRKSIKQ